MIHLTSLIALLMLSVPAPARVIWEPEELDLNIRYNGRASLLVRGDARSCGAAFPDDFTCPGTSTCLALNSRSSIKAVLCCPAGSDCRTIQTVSCDQNLQSATAYPGSFLHSEPTTRLESCGPGCCPMGYSCENGQCSAATPLILAASVPHSLSASSTSPMAFSTTIATSSTTSTTTFVTPTHIPGATPAAPEPSSHSKFSGASFAAGFVPGIFLGAFLAALLLFLLFRRRRPSRSDVNEKGSPHDTLTDLTTLSRRPTMHGRSISEPIRDPAVGHRTDFLRSTPPRMPNGTIGANGYRVGVSAPLSAPRTPAHTPRAVKALFSRSPSTPPSTQPPLPGHLKRGTLSFKISPVRQLKKQKSMHSLRRHVTETSRGSTRRAASGDSRSGSTETIQVLMPSNEPYTPDQRPQPKRQEPPATLDATVYQPTNSSTSTWSTTGSPELQPQAAPAQYASSSRYPTEHFTPTRLPHGSNADSKGGLGTPYTPSRYYDGKGRVAGVLVGTEGGLRVVREPEKRDTTFSAMMERAGLRKSDLLMGTNNRR